jgi:hypothetical protein
MTIDELLALDDKGIADLLGLAAPKSGVFLRGLFQNADQIRLRFDNGINGCSVIGNTFRHSASGDCVAQSGSAGTGGNITLASNWRAIDSSWI